MTYKYKDPLENGYTRVDVSKEQHNSMFKFRQRNLLAHRYEYYLKERTMLIHCFSSEFVIFLNVMAYPVIMLINGVINYKELNRSYRNMLNEKKYGSFTSDEHRVI